MKLKLSLAFLLAVAFIAPAAFPCGAPFGTGINVDPKQDIVVVHKDGVETYVFQPRFCGTASEFGLILPIPARLSAAPTLSKATVFTQVDSLSRPEYRTQGVCDSGGRPGSAGGTGTSRGADAGGATVVSSGSVGFMDYTQLKADTTASFTDWLDKNGYPYDTLAKDAFSYYVNKGWYLLAFKISHGAVSAGTTVCKDLGPVKFSFPSDLPVVPTRMATARNRDSSGALAYASSFSWRVFGITTGTKQIGFTDGSTYRRTLGYSGLLKAADITSLDGLAAAGDRLDKLSLSFDYGSTEPDVALNLSTGSDYREIITSYYYVPCPEAGAPDVPPAGPDVPSSGPDATVANDAGPTPVDTLSLQPNDANTVPNLDAVQKLDSEQPLPSKQDAGIADTAVVKPVLADASVPISTKTDAAKGPSSDEPTGNKSSGGCSIGSARAGHEAVVLLVFALALGLRRRTRRR
jgi:hypothetical protein